MFGAAEIQPRLRGCLVGPVSFQLLADPLIRVATLKLLLLPNISFSHGSDVEGLS
jgi:hypothetical protein